MYDRSRHAGADFLRVVQRRSLGRWRCPGAWGPARRLGASAGEAQQAPAACEHAGRQSRHREALRTRTPIVCVDAWAKGVDPSDRLAALAKRPQRETTAPGSWGCPNGWHGPASAKTGSAEHDPPTVGGLVWHHVVAGRPAPNQLRED